VAIEGYSAGANFWRTESDQPRTARRIMPSDPVFAKTMRVRFQFFFAADLPA
jgi:hypothetical protein